MACGRPVDPLRSAAFVAMSEWTGTRTWPSTSMTTTAAPVNLFSSDALRFQSPVSSEQDGAS
jgi:hypothetical protein